MSPADFLTVTGSAAAPAQVAGPSQAQGAQSGNTASASTSTLGAAVMTAAAFFALVLVAELLAHVGKAR